MLMPYRQRLTPHDERTIAATAFCDPRSVRKAVAGEVVAPLTMARIRHALASMGRSDLLASNGNRAEPPPQAA
jgi:hypothetical protein